MTQRSPAEVISDNLRQIHQEIADACERSGRNTDSVRLVAVTKYAELPWIEALSSQHQVFGENRPQQLAERKALWPQIEWHLIGQLQRNKVNLACRNASLIHSVDSLKILQDIAARGASSGGSPDVLLQVNVSGESSKSGFAPDELRHSWGAILDLSRQVPIRGLMTMAPESEDPEEARPVFRNLQRLREELRSLPETARYTIDLSELSMGMSGDFVPAVEEGSTLVRIGSRIFQGLSRESS